MPVAYFQPKPQQLCCEDPQEQRDNRKHIANKKTTLQNTGLFEIQDNLIISSRTVAAFGKYACGIFSAETAAAVLRGPAGTKR